VAAPASDDIAPIPGTKRVSRVEENTAADSLELSMKQIQRLNDLAPAIGERHDETRWPSSTADHLMAVRGDPPASPPCPRLAGRL
jgi:diketogulonate reductase-like aldo/keto reductase